VIGEELSSPFFMERRVRNALFLLFFYSELYQSLYFVRYPGRRNRPGEIE
jgi:hypothetical protein